MYCKSKYDCMPHCKPMKKCKPVQTCKPSYCDPCEMYEYEPSCRERYVGTYTTKYKVYADCDYNIGRVCGYCGHEYDAEEYDECPMCNAPASMAEMAMDDDDPGGNPDGFGFGRRRRRFFPRFFFFPPFFFFFRRRRRWWD
ncbi:hypothetical protein P22_3485 [Propionispora sp. 2/2-37]|nr:hypothetical protein P22_3485 [Propionispora sp. 2/2-37]